MISTLRQWFQQPGQLEPIEDQMPIPDIEGVADEKELANKASSTLLAFEKSTGLDGVLDYATYLAGTSATLLLLIIILVVWVVVGAVFHAPSNWQIAMQDSQSIQCYLWDSILMRQQINYHESFLHVVTRLRSRNITVQRLLANIMADEKLTKGIPAKSITSSDSKSTGSAVDLALETWMDKLSNKVAKVLGSFVFIILFWFGIAAWIACGVIWLPSGNEPPFSGERSGQNPMYSQFGSLWQMYINTAVAVELLVSSVFLQNIRRRHNDFVTKYLQEISILDYSLESQLRVMTKDVNPNAIVKTEYPPRTWAEKCIDYYSRIIGTMFGVWIAIIVFAVWIGVGTLMQWSSNWWLIIGTYTGLAGFLDGFILRNVYSRMSRHEFEQLSIFSREDRQNFEIIGVSVPEEQLPSISRLERLSNWFAELCSSSAAVGVALAILIGLLCASSALKWSLFGQLLSNTPTMIIEGFFLLILIQGANWKDMHLRVELYNICLRRRTLVEYIDTLSAEGRCCVY
ncbi:hypothetical protein V1525DRAFT_408342 [Lipomyces kononenkoae]|uniref:Uncharacterized protein n=1 Tax=Lipomyces kononenkoae TaxID=34357 RepID=A0ACC3SXT5_LIPKO